MATLAINHQLERGENRMAEAIFFVLDGRDGGMFGFVRNVVGQEALVLA